MFWINKKNFLSLMEEAFIYGLSGSAENIDEICKDLLIKTKPINLSFDFYSLNQLQKFQKSNTIIHPIYGEGECYTKNGEFGFLFSNSRFESVNCNNANFWAIPIAVLNRN